MRCKKGHQKERVCPTLRHIRLDFSGLLVFELLLPHKISCLQPPVGHRFDVMIKELVLRKKGAQIHTWNAGLTPGGGGSFWGVSHSRKPFPFFFQEPPF